MNRIYSRLIVDHLSENRQMALLSGPRQVGKTTLARAVLPSAVYLNYDVVDDALKIRHGVDQIVATLNLDTPARQSHAVVFGEIHKYAQWKRFLKGVFDRYEKDLKIIATGSARMDIYRRGGDSLMGRAFNYRVHPLSIGELASDACDLEELFQRPKDISLVDRSRLLQFGGFPEPYLNGTRRFYVRWQNSRLDKIFNEDLRDLSRVQDLRGVRAMAELLQMRVSGEINYASLARDLGVSSDTVKGWIGLLESVYFCYSVRPYFKNVSNSIRKMPKIYLWDWSLVADRGARNENFVASHLLKSVDWWTDSGLGRFEFGYIRDKQQHEVDFVVVKDGEPWMLIEVKSSLDEPLSHNLKAFAEKLKVGYAFQVAVEAEPSSINPLDYEGKVVKMSFADLAKVLI